MIYAGFWQRLSAAVVDFLVLSPLTVLSFWALGTSASLAIAATCSVYFIYYAYSVVGHAIWGRTLGKHLVGIRVRDERGGAIGWSRAFRRSAVDIALGTASLVGYSVVLNGIPASDFATSGWQEMFERYDNVRPGWARAVEYAYWVWVVSEVFTVLLNRRRRAIHDLIAGTVVLVERQVALEMPTLAEARSPWMRAWTLVDHLGALVGLATAGVFVLGAFYAGMTEDSDGFTGTLIIASYALLIALLLALAQRALRRNRRRHTWLRLGAGMLVALPAGLLALMRS